MSLFIRVNRFGSAPRFYCVRSHSALFGEDSHGIFGPRPGGAAHFAIYHSDDRYFIAAESAELRHTGTLLPSKVLVLLTTGMELHSRDYSMSFFPTSPIAELAAGCEGTPVEILTSTGLSNLGVRITVAGLNREYALPEGVTVSLGSGLGDTIMLELPNLPTKALTLLARNSKVTVQGYNAKLELPRQESLPAEGRFARDSPAESTIAGSMLTEAKNGVVAEASTPCEQTIDSAPALLTVPAFVTVEPPGLRLQLFRSTNH